MDVVTGAFGYIGRYIAAHLLRQDSQPLREGCGLDQQ